MNRLNSILTESPTPSKYRRTNPSTPSLAPLHFSPSTPLPKSQQSLFHLLEKDTSHRSLALRALDKDVNTAKDKIGAILQEFHPTPSPGVNDDIATISNESCLTRIEGLRKALMELCIVVPSVADVVRPISKEYELLIRRLLRELYRSPAVTVVEELKVLGAELLRFKHENAELHRSLHDMEKTMKAMARDMMQLQQENIELGRTVTSYKGVLVEVPAPNAELFKKEDSFVGNKIVQDAAAAVKENNNVEEEVAKIKALLHEVDILRTHVNAFHEIVQDSHSTVARKNTEIDDLVVSLDVVKKELELKTRQLDVERAKNATTGEKIAGLMKQVHDLVASNALASWCITKEIPTLLNRVVNTFMNDDPKKVPLFKIRKRKDGQSMVAFSQTNEEFKLPVYYTTGVHSNTVRAKPFTLPECILQVRSFWDHWNKNVPKKEFAFFAAEMVSFCKSSSEVLYSWMDACATYRNDSALVYEFLRIAEGTLPLAFHTYFETNVEDALVAFMESNNMSVANPQLLLSQNAKSIQSLGATAVFVPPPVPTVEVAQQDQIIEGWLPYSTPPDRLPFVVAKLRKVSPQLFIPEMLDELRKQYLLFHDHVFVAFEKNLLKKTPNYSSNDTLVMDNVLAVLENIVVINPPTPYSQGIVEGVQTVFQKLASAHESPTVQNIVRESESVLLFNPEAKCTVLWGFMKG
eukprot:PhF_6_TR40429/c0_g2_i2/m.60284